MTLAPTTQPTPARAAAALELRGITKWFPGVVANDGVDFCVAPGEVHALLGENGAGKTTLSHIVAGLNQPDESEIRLRPLARRPAESLIAFGRSLFGSRGC